MGFSGGCILASAPCPGKDILKRRLSAPVLDGSKSGSFTI